MASYSHHEMASDLMNPILCDICTKFPAKHHCNTCGDALCPTCKEYHLRSKGTRHHQIVPYAQKLNPKHLIGLSCHNHPNNAPEFWCKTCGVPICVSCITDKHNGHKFSNITSKLSEKRDKMVEEMKNLRDNTVVEWEGVLKQAQGITAGYLVDIEKVDKDLVARAKEMHKLVDDILSHSQSALQEMKVTGLEKLQEQEKYLADRLEQLKEDVRRYEDKLQEADANVLLQFEKSTTQNVDKPRPLETVSISVFTPGQDDTKSLQRMFGTIAKNNASEKKKDSKQSSARGEATQVSDSRKTKVQSIQSSPEHDAKARTLITQPTVNSQFDVDSGSPYIACTEQGLAWVMSYMYKFLTFGRRIQLMNREGSVNDKFNIDFTINDMAVTPDGDLLLADSSNKCIRSKSRQKNINTLFSTSGNPYGLCYLHNGDIVVTFGDERKVIVYSRDGQVRQTLDNITFRCPRKVAVNKVNQDIYICDHDSFDSYRGKLIAVWIDGQQRFKYTGQGDKDFYPSNVCTDQIGHVFIADRYNHRVHMLNQEGQFIQYILTSQQGLRRPVTIDVDSDGYVWVGEDHGIYNKGYVKMARYLQ